MSTEQPSNEKSSEPQSTDINADKSKDEQSSGMNIWLKIGLILLAVIIVLVIALSIYLYFNPKIGFYNKTMFTIMSYNYYFYDKVFSLKPPNVSIIKI